MKKVILILFVVIILFKMGISYFLSDKFQDYGDRTKATWTCHLNGFMAEFYIVFSQYERALDLYKKNEKRCENTPLEEKAAYKIAYCHENIGQFRIAIQKYKEFIERFPNSKRTRELIPRKLQIIETSR